MELAAESVKDIEPHNLAQMHECTHYGLVQLEGYLFLVEVPPGLVSLLGRTPGPEVYESPLLAPCQNSPGCS